MSNTADSSGPGAKGAAAPAQEAAFEQAHTPRTTSQLLVGIAVLVIAGLLSWGLYTFLRKPVTAAWGLIFCPGYRPACWACAVSGCAGRR